jgi:hypothetical protein
MHFHHFYGGLKINVGRQYRTFYSFMCMFCRSLFVLLYFFVWPLCCLFFDLWVLITPLYLQALHFLFKWFTWVYIAYLVYALFEFKIVCYYWKKNFLFIFPLLGRAWRYKGVIRTHKSKNRQHNGQTKKYKRTNNDLQNIHIKL